MKIIIVVLLFYTSSFFCQINYNDSQFEKKRIEIENKTATDNEYALKEAILLLEYAERTKSSSKIAKALATLSSVKISLADTEEADVINKKSLAINLKLNNTNEIAKNYYNEASILSRKSDFVKAIELFLKSINFAEKNKNYIIIQKDLRGIANSYCDQRNYDLALKYALKALDYSKFESTINEISYLKATIAEIYRLKNDLLNANIYFESAYINFCNVNDKSGQAYVLTNWSLCYEDNYEKLLEMELQAQEIWDKIAPENLMSVTNLGNIAYTYFEIAKNDSLKKSIKNLKIEKNNTNLLTLSETYYTRCLSIAKKKKNLDSILYFSEALSELQEYKGSFSKALINLKLRNKINDSLYSQKNKNKIASIESEREIELKNNQIKLNKITLASKEKQKYYFIGGLFLLAIIGGLLFYQSSNRKKVNEKLSFLNKELDESNKAKTRFFSILNHDLRGPVANLIFFLQLQKESPELLDEENTKRMQDKTISGAENLLNSMEDILQWSKSQMENFKPQFKNISIDSLFKDIKNHFASEENIKITFENFQDLQLKTDDNYLKTILRNLTGNAIKALHEVENPTIIWNAWQEPVLSGKNGKVILSITDNGNGVSQEQLKALYDEKEIVELKSGLGLHLIRDLAKAIDCDINVESKIGSGTTFTLKIA